MRLLIVSNMAHYRRGDQVVGWGPAVREIDEVAELFSEVRHVGCLHEGPAPDSALPYTSEKVRLVPLAPAGGVSVSAKLGIASRLPGYICTLLRELAKADVVHLRCPCNVCLVALPLLALPGGPKVRWAKYAGNWKPAEPDGVTYGLQRWWLRKGLHRGCVTINGEWPGQPPHVHSLVNPCLSTAEVEAGRLAAAAKALTTPVRLLFAGALKRDKGVHHVLRIAHNLLERGCDLRLDLVGDGPERPDFEQSARELGIAPRTVFHGWLPRPRIAEHYAQAHFLLLPSKSEGWPKVIGEAMAFGAVPVASSVGSIPQYLSQFGCGAVCSPADTDGFTDQVLQYVGDPARWRAESLRGVQAADQFSYRAFVAKIREILLAGEGQ